MADARRPRCKDEREERGAVYLRADGRWEAQFRMADGRRKCLYGRTRREVLSKLRETRWAVAHGLPVSSRKLLLSEYLEYWLEMTRCRGRTKPLPELRTERPTPDPGARQDSIAEVEPTSHPGGLSAPPCRGPQRPQRLADSPRSQSLPDAGIPLGPASRATQPSWSSRQGQPGGR